MDELEKALCHIEKPESSNTSSVIPMSATINLATLLLQRPVEMDQQQDTKQMVFAMGTYPSRGDDQPTSTPRVEHTDDWRSYMDKRLH